MRKNESSRAMRIFNRKLSDYFAVLIPHSDRTAIHSGRVSVRWYRWEMPTRAAPVENLHLTLLSVRIPHSAAF